LTGRADVLGVRIALVTDTYLPQVNGVTTVVRRIADTLRAAAYDVVVVAPRYPHGPGGDGVTMEFGDVKAGENDWTDVTK